MDGDIENSDVSGVNGSMNTHKVLSQNGLSSLINLNNKDYIETNAYFKNGEMSCGICFIKIHTLSQCNKTIYFNDIYGGVENGDVIFGHFL